MNLNLNTRFPDDHATEDAANEANPILLCLFRSAVLHDVALP
jgi:hypothetical protein